MYKSHKVLSMFFAVILSLTIVSVTTQANPLPELNVTISGASTLAYGESATYTATGSGGQAPYTFLWYYSEDGDSWTSKGYGTSKSITGTGVDFYLKCSITDNVGLNTTTTITVTAEPVTVTVSGPSTVTYGSTGTYTATASAGLPPYSYTWTYIALCIDLESLSDSSIIQPYAVPCGYWFTLGYTTATANKGADGLYRTCIIKCLVTDANGETASATKTTATISALQKDNRAFQLNAEKLEDEITETTLANYPNPFNPTTTIAFSLPESGFISLKVYDMLGREVAVLANSVHNAGKYNYKFNAGGLASGTYIYRLVTPNKTITQKMLLVK